MDKLADIPVIVPSLQPDDRIIHVARELLASGLQNIIVIDDGSGPNYSSYYEELTDLGCTVIHHAVNLGKGRALKTAFNYCFLNFPDLVGCVTVDSDGQHSVQNALECIEALTMHPHCLIMGCRDFSSDNVPFKNRYGNKITVGMFKTICGVSCSDTQTGLRAIPADFMRTLMNVSGERFEFESYMLVESKKCGFKIFEVPIETIYQETYTTHFNPFRDSLRIYAIFFKYIASSVFSTCVDLALFTLGVWLLSGIAPTLYITIATIVARIISCAINYTLNLKTVFKTDSQNSLLKYAVLSVVIMLLSALGVTLLHRVLNISELPVKIIVDVVLFIVSFMSQREFVFAEKKNKEQSE